MAKPSYLYTLHIKSAPYQSQSCRTALCFAEALLKKGHTIKQVFFSGEAVVIANDRQLIPQDEESMTSAWAELSDRHRFPIDICSAAAVRRGVLGESEALQYQQANANLVKGYTIAGLGQFIESAALSDRVITF